MSSVMNEPGEGHIVKGYDVDLAGLRLRLLEMGGLVLDQMQSAVRALVERNRELARAVVEREGEVRACDQRIEEDSISLIARRQPMGSDLRVVISIARAVTDLERVGHEAKKIARYAAEEGRSRVPSLARDVRVMARLAGSMLREALDAFDRMNPQAAFEVARRDVELNAEFHGAMRKLVTVVMENPRRMQDALSAVFVLKALERIGDHAKNIARHIVYLVHGRDARYDDTGVHASLDGQRSNG